MAYPITFREKTWITTATKSKERPSRTVGQVRGSALVQLGRHDAG